jgi:hypothetical protein
MSKILEQNHVGFGSGSEKIIPDPQTRKLALKVKCSYHNSCANRSAAEPCTDIRGLQCGYERSITVDKS